MDNLNNGERKVIRTDEGILLTEVVEDVKKRKINEKNSKNSANSSKQFRHANPALAGIGTLTASAANVYILVAGYGVLWAAVSSVLALIGSLWSKGDEDSKFCTVMAVCNAVQATAFIARKLVELGIFDWLAFSI